MAFIPSGVVRVTVAAHMCNYLLLLEVTTPEQSVKAHRYSKKLVLRITISEI